MPPPFDDGDKTGFTQDQQFIHTVEPIVPPLDANTDFIPGHPGQQNPLPIPDTTSLDDIDDDSGGGGGGGGLELPPDVSEWLKTHIKILFGGNQRPPTNPINKNNGPDLNPGPNGCDLYDMAELQLALNDAQSIIRSTIEDLKRRLAPCDKDGRMGTLLACIEDEGLPYKNAYLLSHIGCSDPIVDEQGQVHDKAEARTYYQFDPWKHTVGTNNIIFDLKKILKDANDNMTKFRDILKRDMLHELMHNCTDNLGGGDSDNYPEVTDLDVMVLTNMMGFPRDTRGVDKLTAFDLQFVPDNQAIIDKKKREEDDDPTHKTILPTAGPPWINGNFFIWDPGSGRVLCSDSVSSKPGTGTDWGGSDWHEIFGEESGSLPPIKMYNV